MILKTYEEFAPKQFLLPAHGEENVEFDSREGGSRIVFTLKELYDLEKKNIALVANRINQICDSGAYITVRHTKTDMKLIMHNEPRIIIGVEGGRTISLKNYKDLKINADSIIINEKSDDSLYILSVKDDYEFVFIVPKVIVSKHDPYGEEDWGED